MQCVFSYSKERISIIGVDRLYLLSQIVGKTDIYQALQQMALACDLGDCVDTSVNGSAQFPGRLLPQLGSAIVSMSKWVRNAGGPISGDVYTIHQEYVDDPRIGFSGNRPRIDLEQLVGTNFR